MKKIDISTKTYQDTFTLVDDRDYDRLAGHKWYVQKGKGLAYAVRADCSVSPPKKLLMHRVIMGDPVGMDVDHRHGNGLNNQRYNLRVCTHARNVMNCRKPDRNTSGYKGVSWVKNNNKWAARIRVNTKLKHLGLFTCLIKAAKAYDAAAKEYFGEFASLNFPTEKRVSE